MFVTFLQYTLVVWAISGLDEKLHPNPKLMIKLYDLVTKIFLKN